MRNKPIPIVAEINTTLGASGISTGGTALTGSNWWLNTCGVLGSTVSLSHVSRPFGDAPLLPGTTILVTFGAAG
jgi:hypothetical protein